MEGVGTDRRGEGVVREGQRVDPVGAHERLVRREIPTADPELEEIAVDTDRAHRAGAGGEVVHDVAEPACEVEHRPVIGGQRLQKGERGEVPRLPVTGEEVREKLRAEPSRGPQIAQFHPVLCRQFVEPVKHPRDLAASPGHGKSGYRTPREGQPQPRPCLQPERDRRRKRQQLDQRVQPAVGSDQLHQFVHVRTDDLGPPGHVVLHVHPSRPQDGDGIEDRVGRGRGRSGSRTSHPAGVGSQTARTSSCPGIPGRSTPPNTGRQKSRTRTPPSGDQFGPPAALTTISSAGQESIPAVSGRGARSGQDCRPRAATGVENLQHWFCCPRHGVPCAPQQRAGGWRGRDRVRWELENCSPPEPVAHVSV